MSGDFPSFRQVNVNSAWAGDYALDLLYFRAFGAAKAGDQDLYFSALKAGTGSSDTGGDRRDDFRQLLSSYGFPQPLITHFGVDSGNQWTVVYGKDAPELEYRCEEAGNLAAGPWQLLDLPETVTSAGAWSVILPQADANQRWVRIQATIP